MAEMRGGQVSTTGDSLATVNMLVDYVPMVSRAATFTYNSDGTIATMTAGTKTYTYTWNGDGTLATESDGTTTRTYTYTSGNVTTVA